MQVFISWSGEVSNRIAVLLRDWLPNVLQAVRPFVSSQDIAKGSRGMDHIAEQLSSTDYGLLVLTSDNVKAPWVNFEAGALSKSLGKSNVIPLLCGLRELDMQNSPLRQFQHSKVEREDMFAVITSLNSGCAAPLDLKRLEASFNQWWLVFEEAYSAVDLQQAAAPVEAGPGLGAELSNVLDDMLQELSAIRRDIKSSTHLQNTWAAGPLGGLLSAGTISANAISDTLPGKSGGLLSALDATHRDSILESYITAGERNHAESLRRAAALRRKVDETQQSGQAKPGNKTKG